MYRMPRYTNNVQMFTTCGVKIRVDLYNGLSMVLAEQSNGSTRRSEYRLRQAKSISSKY